VAAPHVPPPGSLPPKAWKSDAQFVVHPSGCTPWEHWRPRRRWAMSRERPTRRQRSQFKSPATIHILRSTEVKTVGSIGGYATRTGACRRLKCQGMDHEPGAHVPRYSFFLNRLLMPFVALSTLSAAPLPMSFAASLMAWPAAEPIPPVIEPRTRLISSAGVMPSGP